MQWVVIPPRSGYNSASREECWLLANIKIFQQQDQHLSQGSLLHNFGQVLVVVLGDCLTTLHIYSIHSKASSFQNVSYSRSCDLSCLHYIINIWLFGWSGQQDWTLFMLAVREGEGPLGWMVKSAEISIVAKICVQLLFVLKSKTSASASLNYLIKC